MKEFYIFSSMGAGKDLVWTVMTARFRLPAGRTYNVRASELARDRQHTEVVCNVLLLDNTVQAFKVNKHDQGQVLLDLVFKHLDLTERDYFGLQLADDSTDSPESVKRTVSLQNHFVKLQIIVQRIATSVTLMMSVFILGGSPHSLNFRVKFFVSDPNKLQEEYTRYQYFLQLKQDILTGRLPCPYNTAALLASYAVQSELGDYSHSEHLPGYLADYSFIPNQHQDFEKEIAKLHQQHKGLSPAEVEFNYLNTARTLELYGVELHYARDQSNTEIMIGVMSGGIVIYKNRVRINWFPWVCLVSVSMCKQFLSKVAWKALESRETLLGFNMVNYRGCKNLWKACVEHHTFFRLDRPLPPQKNFFAHYFTLGSKFRYCGRTEVQSVQYGKEKANKDRVFARSPSKPLARKLMSGMDWEVVSRNSLSDERLETQSLPSRSPPGTPNHRNSTFAQEGTRLRPSSVGHLVDHVVHISTSEVFANHKSPSSTQANSIILESSPSQETTADGQPPALPPKQSKKNSLNQIHQSYSQLELDNHIAETYDIPAPSDKLTPNGVIPHDNLVLIRMRPDENGRFGFNVKGGLDQKMPVIVSRVAPGTPADLCVPRLNEGDQVVLINDRDISDHTHDQVVMFIKASCEKHSGELILLVRPNAVYDVVEEKLESEPDFQYIPEKSPLDGIHEDDNALRESMAQLKEALICGSILTQFDVSSTSCVNDHKNYSTNCKNKGGAATFANQTPTHQSQYRFVCEAILKVYEGQVKPLKTTLYKYIEED
nr:PREDICTED: tyrosine-protein phosphatase non-receptor type 4 [Latimeria chalumnae]|eukprot:XP_014340810.1 PREDICTED: tyrosine-protein phosphatase non-receptor type 4 [Latimeria chalumnae]